APSQVTIQIFDISGKRVAMLVNTSQKANVYEVQWNPTNISSGVYFGRVSVRNSNGYKTEVIKMTYMK
ncbi:MAG: T9SS type A sorting domain-containing protein, partial [Candidatus Marinimicrobia bacterium]|nr:T9SS type A sorting domain-containing protein [Candidatus Neomarinimicrobiota bacterium]